VGGMVHILPYLHEDQKSTTTTIARSNTHAQAVPVRSPEEDGTGAEANTYPHNPYIVTNNDQAYA